MLSAVLRNIFFTETHVGDNGHVFVHMKLIPSSNSFAVCFRNFNFLAIQRVNVLQTVDPRAFKTSQGIRGGAPLSGSAAVGAAQQNSICQSELDLQLSAVCQSMYCFVPPKSLALSRALGPTLSP